MVPESFENLPYDDIKRIYSRHSAKVSELFISSIALNYHSLIDLKLSLKKLDLLID